MAIHKAPKVYICERLKYGPVRLIILASHVCFLNGVSVIVVVVKSSDKTRVSVRIFMNLYIIAQTGCHPSHNVLLVLVL